MRSTDHGSRPSSGNRRVRRTAILGLVVAAGITALSSLSMAAASQSAMTSGASASYVTRHVAARVLTPQPGERTSGAFNIDVSLRAKDATGNDQLSGYASKFIDPDSAAFGPGASDVAPGLVVTLSTTPSIPNTPLVGPQTNLAGVFQINDVTRLNGLKRTHNDWQVTSAGFFGQHTAAVLTVYAVAGQAPDVIPSGGLTPISNVVTETFQIN
jgi:hypothetical protein